jgi:Fur family transcriptional regulator, ferric uptake regulator
MAHNVDREVHRFQEFLQGQGLKLTPERTALVREIFSIHYHFEADELLFKMKEKHVKISRATVYRTLELLVKSGLVRRVHLGEDHYHYEHVSGNSHHDHLICTTCGGVIEFHDEELERLQMAICETKKFTPTFHNLQILGVCDPCRRKGQQPDSPDRVRMIGQTRLRK